MSKLLEKINNSDKFKTKVNLLLSIIFIVIVTIYVISYDRHNSDLVKENNKNIENILNITGNYSYFANIKIDDAEYKYKIVKNDDVFEIIKIDEENIERYIYKNLKYYKLCNNDYILVDKREIFDNINFSYIDLSTINLYLSNATKVNNQYLVYLKDIILGENSENYFVILVNDNKISIDYTSLIKQINSKINKYIVDIEIIKDS